MAFLIPVCDAADALVLGARRSERIVLPKGGKTVGAGRKLAGHPVH